MYVAFMLSLPLVFLLFGTPSLHLFNFWEFFLFTLNVHIDMYIIHLPTNQLWIMHQVVEFGSDVTRRVEIYNRLWQQPGCIDHNWEHK